MRCVPQILDEGVRAKLQAAIAESFVAGFRWVMGLCALMALASAAIAHAMIAPATTLPKAMPWPID